MLKIRCIKTRCALQISLADIFGSDVECANNSYKNKLFCAWCSVYSIYYVGLMVWVSTLLIPTTSTCSVTHKERNLYCCVFRCVVSTLGPFCTPSYMPRQLPLQLAHSLCCVAIYKYLVYLMTRLIRDESFCCFVDGRVSPKVSACKG